MYQRLSFAGVNKPSGSAPSAYDSLLESHGRTAIGGFDQLVQTLDDQYSIEERPAMFGSQTDAGVLPATRHKVLVNPAWEGNDAEDIPGDREDSVWNIPSKGYATVTHGEPLTQLREAVMNRYDPEEVFGVTRLRREGAEMNTDLFTHSDAMDGLDTDDELYLGISTGHDYTSTTRLYVDVVALLVPSSGSARILRYLINPRKRKHTGDAEGDVVDWYGDALDRLDRVSDKLYNVVADAMYHDIEMDEYPCGLSSWFSHLGLPSNAPSNLADPAARFVGRSRSGTTISAWEAYKAGMSAIESEYDSRDTAAFKNHVTTVNTLLFNPSLAEKQVLASVEESIVEARTTDDEDEPEPTDVTAWSEDEYDDPLEGVRERADSISEGVEKFESTREKVRVLLNDEAPDTDEDDDKAVARAEADD